jgi:hypothetical protein
MSILTLVRSGPKMSSRHNEAFCADRYTTEPELAGASACWHRVSMLQKRCGPNKLIWVACGLLVLVAKLALAVNRFGTNDVATWHRFGDAVAAHGPLWLCHADPLFNHPPFMMQVLTLLLWLSSHLRPGSRAARDLPCFNHGLPWHFADSITRGGWPKTVIIFELLPWLVIGLTFFAGLWRCWRSGSFRNLRNNRITASPSVPVSSGA